jgi:hypothetical protein
MLDAIISGGASIAGGLISDYSNRKAASKAYSRSQKAIRNTVADAKAAGIHPLYALGNSAGYSSPVAINDGAGTGLAEAGRSIAEGIREKRDSARADRVADAQIAESKARTLKAVAEARESNAAADQVENAMAASVASRILQETNQRNLELPSGIKFQTGTSVPAEEVEQNYGGLSGELYGLWRLMRDASNQPKTPLKRRKDGKKLTRRGYR